jgi:ParB-like chromosome segregation protein Spo0J
VSSDQLISAVEQANRLYAEAAALLSFDHPVARLQWVHIDKIHSNDWNPNSVAPNELRLLHVSVEQDGYTQPIVTVYDQETDRWVIVDGFHRYALMRNQRDIYDTTGGYLPVVVIDKPLADRIASTVRHNRARGKHSIAGMSALVFRMLEAGEPDEVICNKIGLEAEELARLKHITGYAKLHADHVYPRAVLTDRQMQAKQAYAAAHPGEHVPTDF